MLNVDVLENMYTLWLSGLSLRKIGRRYHLGKSTVWAKLTAVYGGDACNLRKQSLARVCYKEYGDLQLALRARGIEGLYMSEQTERNYSKHKTYDMTKIQLANPNSTYEPSLLFAYYHYLVRTVADIVAIAYASALVEMADLN